MAVTTQNSTEYGNSIATPIVKSTPDVENGRVQCAFFTHAQSGAGDATSSVAIAKLPPGKVRLLAHTSYAYVNWTTMSATLDLGWDAYVEPDGTSQAASVNGIDDGVSVETAGIINFGSALNATGRTKLFESREGVVIRASSTDTAIADGDDLVGCLFYVYNG